MSEKAASSTDKIVTGEYCLGLQASLSDLDMKAIFRESVTRLRQILFERFFASGSLQIPNQVESDRRLIDGELDLLVPPNHTIQLQAQPMVVFRPTRLVLDDASAECYDVVDIKVGKNSQLVGSGRLPGSAFRAGNTQDYRMDTAQMCMYCTVLVVNVSNKPRPLPRAMLIGLSGHLQTSPQIAAGLDFPSV